MKWSLLLLIAVLLAACSSRTQLSETQTNSIQTPQATAGSYTNISAEELKDMIASKDGQSAPAFTLVNVHIPFEGEIAGTDLSIPYNEIEQNLDRLPLEQDARLVLYCRSGRMSTIASEKLAKLGYTNVMNLDGGMIAWEKAGLPLEGK